jgi:hypothetical protein
MGQIAVETAKGSRYCSCCDKKVIKTNSKCVSFRYKNPYPTAAHVCLQCLCRLADEIRR